MSDLRSASFAQPAAHLLDPCPQHVARACAERGGLAHQTPWAASAHALCAPPLCRRLHTDDASQQDLSHAAPTHALTLCAHVAALAALAYGAQRPRLRPHAAAQGDEAAAP